MGKGRRSGQGAGAGCDGSKEEGMKMRKRLNWPQARAGRVICILEAEPGRRPEGRRGKYIDK